MSPISRIYVGNYKIEMVEDDVGRTWWTCIDRRTATPVMVDGEPLALDTCEEAEAWAKQHSQVERRP